MQRLTSTSSPILPSTEGELFGKVSIWEPESMRKITRRKTILSLYINVYSCSFKTHHPQNLNLESEQMNEGIMWTYFSLLLLIISNLPPPA